MFVGTSKNVKVHLTSINNGPNPEVSKNGAKPCKVIIVITIVHCLAHHNDSLGLGCPPNILARATRASDLDAGQHHVFAVAQKAQPCRVRQSLLRVLVLKHDPANLSAPHIGWAVLVVVVIVVVLLQVRPTHAPFGAVELQNPGASGDGVVWDPV